MTDGKFIAYYRTSRKQQTLGLDAQKMIVTNYLNGGDWQLLGEFEEQESGKRHENRPALAAAIAACKKHKATLVIAKLDRLARNVAFISALMESKVKFICCDNPNANKLTIHILAAVAEDERETIAKRTSDALQALKAKGVKLGNPNPAASLAKSAETRAKAADQHAANVLPIVEKIKAQGATTLREIAEALNERGVKTARGGQWYAMTVKNLLDRA